MNPYFDFARTLKLAVGATVAMLLVACSTQGREVVKELEDLPGISCSSQDGVEKCGPDNPAMWDQQGT